MDSNSFEGSSPFSWADIFDVDLPTSPTLSFDLAPKRSYSCNICGSTYAQPQGLARHLREKSSFSSCLYCGFKWCRLYQYRAHLKEHHPAVDPDVVVGQANSIRLCMYCDVEWNQTSQYKDHLRGHHPNVDPDAVLGEIPGSQRWNKIIARYKFQGQRVRARGRDMVSFMTHAPSLPSPTVFHTRTIDPTPQ